MPAHVADGYGDAWRAVGDIQEIIIIAAGLVAVPAHPGDVERADVEAMWAAVVNLYGTRLHPGIAMCVRRRGQVVLDRAIGHERGNSPGDPKGGPTVQATPSSLFNLFSASKAVTAMVIHRLDEQRVLHLDDAVVEYFPEFGKNGKEGVTMDQLLSSAAAEKLSALMTVEHLRQRGLRAKREDFVAFLDASPDLPPLPGDEL